MYTLNDAVESPVYTLGRWNAIEKGVLTGGHYYYYYYYENISHIPCIYLYILYIRILPS